MTTIVGTVENDNLLGAQQDDYIFGGLGNDTLVLAEDGDGGVIDGWSGNDLITGSSQTDILLGYTGDDSLLGGVGKDLLLGEIGNDSLLGGADTDLLFGGTGNDTLDGYGQTEFEYDFLRGGAGADLFVLGNQDGAFYQQAGFATITDFNSLQGDQIQVFGSIEEYTLAEFDSGTDIYYQDNLIGYVANTVELSLESDFIFV